VDSLLFNQPDSAFFQRTAEIEQVAFDILASTDEPGIWLAGPGTWNSEKNASMPFALVWKISSYRNGGVLPESHGYMILSHAAGGKAILRKLDEEDKLPQPEESGATEPSPTSGRERLSGGEMWWNADSSLVAGRPGEWTAAILCGGWISNLHRFQVIEPMVKDASGEVNSTAVKLTPEESAAYARTPMHPAPPARGVQFKLGVSQDGKRRPFLFGSYTFPEADAKSDIILNALISGLGYKDADQWSINLPKSVSQSQGGMRTGFFVLDLEQRLKNPRLEKFEFPEDTYITFLHGLWFGNPVHLDPKAIR
jgi:hypothetical protein